MARGLLTLEPISIDEVRATLAAHPELSWAEAAATKLPNAEEITAAVAQAIAEMFRGAA